VIEDGPTVTHGDMTTGAAKVAATKFGAAELVDPRPFLKGSLVKMFELYPHITDMLPAEGYGGEMLKDMEETVNAVDCDAVIVGTPIDLARIIDIKKPSTRVYYDLQEIGRPNFTDILDDFVKAQGLK
jgi:predicted GTPase